MINSIIQRIIWRLQRIATLEQRLKPTVDELPKITYEQLDRIRNHFAMPKFFILGYSRSGKTLLSRLVRLHPDVHCNGHAYFFSQRWNLIQLLTGAGLEQNFEWRGNRWTRGKRMMTPLIRVACDYILEQEATLLGKRIVGDETPNPNNGTAIRWMNKVYPDAQVLYLIRDGREVMLWRRLLFFIDMPQFLGQKDLVIRDALRRDSISFLKSGHSIFTPAWLEEFAQAWVANVRETVTLANSLYGERFMPLRYEDMISDPFGVMSQLWAFLGASNPGTSLNQAILDEIKKDREIKGHQQKDPELMKYFECRPDVTWRDVFTIEDRMLFEHIAGDELETWGYQCTETSTDLE